MHIKANKTDGDTAGIIDKAEAQDARELFKCYVTCREIHLQIAAIHTLSALATQPFMRDWNIRSLAKEGDRITIQIFRILDEHLVQQFNYLCESPFDVHIFLKLPQDHWLIFTLPGHHPSSRSNSRYLWSIS